VYTLPSYFTFRCLLLYVLIVLVYVVKYSFVKEVHIFENEAAKEEEKSAHHSEFY
jgi:hypothetical protein